MNNAVSQDALGQVQTPDHQTPVSVTQPATIRLWPGIAIIVLQWLVILLPGYLAADKPDYQFYGKFMGPMACTLLLMAWWVFASRIPWRDRWLVLGVMAAAAIATVFLSHPSMRMPLVIYALPAATTAWVVWLLVTPFLRWPQRRAGLGVVIILAWGCFTLLRFDGLDGNFGAHFSLRWESTAEEKLMAELAANTIIANPGAATAVSSLQPGDWPGFRGPGRDSKLAGVRIVTDWLAYPPRELWRHRIGPGWSSFAVIGNRAYTQEQRGPDEAVVCYDAASGSQVWAHLDAVRFDEQMAGPGPRATPTFHDGKIYALGAKGMLNCLDAGTGKVLWAQNIATDSGAEVPMWGFSSSPLIVQGIVTVFAGGPEKKSVLGYDAVTGKLAWSAGEGKVSYCSLQPASLCGVEQLLISTELGLTSFEPTRGKVLWEHPPRITGQVARVTQPAVLNDTDVAFGASFGVGTTRVHLSREGDTWAHKTDWEVTTIKPYFNDMVIHRGYLYGFDTGGFLMCVDLKDGKAKWKERGYDNGQVLLLPDQDLLLVLSEKGAVALVEANPDGRKELARFQAISGKTWNHPVLSHGLLFVRNGEEIACYRLQMESTGELTASR